MWMTILDARPSHVIVEFNFYACPLKHSWPVNQVCPFLEMVNSAQPRHAVLKKRSRLYSSPLRALVQPLDCPLATEQCISMHTYLFDGHYDTTHWLCCLCRTSAMKFTVSRICFSAHFVSIVRWTFGRCLLLRDYSAARALDVYHSCGFPGPHELDHVWNYRTQEY